MTSVHEGLPTVLLEAMYFGKIVIARNVGGIPELIEDGRNGFLYSDIEQAEKIVHSIYNNRNNFNYIGEYAHLYIKSKYSNFIQARKYAEVYKSLL